MTSRNYGFTRRDIRGGSGAGEAIAGEHFDEMAGSIEYYIYRHPNKRIKGYDTLKLHLESAGCEVVHIAGAPAQVGQRYETIRITNGGAEIPIPPLRRAHSWSHQRNLLHMFYKRG